MRSLGLFAAAMLVALVLVGRASEANAQGVYYVNRPVVVSSGYGYGGYPYAVPTYSYEGGWYPGSYMNNYGNYGSYHVMTPYWNGGYRYRYW